MKISGDYNTKMKSETSSTQTYFDVNEKLTRERKTGHNKKGLTERDRCSPFRDVF